MSNWSYLHTAQEYGHDIDLILRESARDFESPIAFGEWVEWCDWMSDYLSLMGMPVDDGEELTEVQCWLIDNMLERLWKEEH